MRWKDHLFDPSQVDQIWADRRDGYITVAAPISGSFDSGHAAFTVRTSLLCARASALEGLAGAPRHTTALRQVEGVVAFDLNLVGWWNLARSADSGAGQLKPYFFVADARHDPNAIRKQRRVVGKG